MSLIMDLLGRLGKKGKGGAIPPSLKKAHKQKSKIPLIFLGITFVAVSIATYFLSTPLIEGLAQPPPPPKVARPLPKERPQPTPPPPPQETKPAEEKPRIPPAVNKDTDAPMRKLMPEEPPPRPKENPTKLAYMANTYFLSGELEKSKEYYERAVALERNPKFARNLVVVYLRLGLFEKAKKLVEDFRDEKIAYTYVAELINLGETEKALKEGEKLLEFDEKGLVLFALGYGTERKGDIKKALLYYEKAYGKNPNDPYITFNYARLLEGVGMFREAKDIYSRALKLSTDEKLSSLIRKRLRYLNRGFELWKGQGD